jgi:hypothetical protein
MRIVSGVVRRPGVEVSNALRAVQMAYLGCTAADLTKVHESATMSNWDFRL